MEKQKNNSPSLGGGKIISLICLIVLTLAFIFACCRNVLPLGNLIVGTFGVMVYPILILLALLSLAKFLGLTYKRNMKATILMTMFLVSLLLVIHSIAAFKPLDAVTNGKTYGEYLGLSYDKITVLGSFGSIFSGLFSLMFGGFTTIIIFSILATIMIGLFIDFELYGKYDEKHIKKLSSRKIRKNVAKSTENVENGKPNYSFSAEESKDLNYTDNDIAHEITSNIDEYSEKGEMSGYVDSDVAHETTIESNNYVDETYAPYQNNIDESYKNINFFGGANNVPYQTNEQINYNQNNYVNGVNYSETPAFSNEVYAEEETPDIFTSSMDEYRRKFIEDTFGMPSNFSNNSFVSEQPNFGSTIPTPNYEAPVSPSYASVQQTYSQSVQPPTYSEPTMSSFAEPETNSFVNKTNTNSNDLWGSLDNFNSPQTPTYVESSFEKPEKSFNFDEPKMNILESNIEPKSSFEFNNSPAFPGMIGGNIDDIGTKENFSSTSAPSLNFNDNASLENNIVAENHDIHDNFDGDLDNKISDIFNINEDDEDESSIVNASLSSFSSEQQSSESQSKGELTDFSFLRKNENEGLVTPEKLVEEDVNQATRFNESTPKFSEPLYSENSVETKDSGLTITSVNPIEPPKVVVQAKEPQIKKFSGYNLGMNGIRYNPPPISLLVPGKPDNGDYTEEQERKSQMLEESLKAFNVPAKVVNIIRGPKITRYELSVPLGVPVKKIPMYELDIKRALAAKTINIQAPIPGSSYVGVELENDTFTSVSERELLESEAFQNCKDPLPIAIGKDISGEIVVKSLAKMVHLLIAGSTGSGKSVFIHSIVMSLLYKHSPEDLRLIMIDPKKVEFNRYNGLPHLLTPEVVMGSDKAINALKWCVKEMDRRYDLMSKSGYNNIEPYNRSELVKAGQFEKFPYIVIIVDELAELMMANKKEVEACIQRITQLARACGMHLILATQRPSVDIISGVIKNNVPSRIAFSLSSGIDSKTILNTVGAEKLLGQGDMLFSPNGTSSMPRLQAAYCSDEEIKAVIDYDKQNNSANYDDAVSSVINAEPQPENEYSNQTNDMPAPKELDSYFKTALKQVMQNGGASTSYLQRRFSIGYSRAAKIIDQMEDRGYIAPATGSKVRKVLITPEQFKEEFGEDFNDLSDL